MRWAKIKEGIILKTILKVIFSGLAAGAVLALWVVALYVPPLECISFALGILFAMVIRIFIEGLDEMDGQRPTHKKKR